MRYAIVESGGKQYKAVEGETIEVDRLPVNSGDKVGLERVLMLVDGEEITVGMPTVSGIQINTTVLNHFKGPKLTVFKYSPKKRIRVKGGHRQQYTRLKVDGIGKPGETRKPVKVKEAEVPDVEKAEAKAEKVEATAKVPAAKEKKAEKALTTSSPKGKKEPEKKTEKASATSSPKGKKPTAKKTTTKSSSPKTTNK